jgi:hypothetical protein
MKNLLANTDAVDRQEIGETIDSRLFLFVKAPAIYCYPTSGSINVGIAPDYNVSLCYTLNNHSYLYAALKVIAEWPFFEGGGCFYGLSYHPQQ